MSSAPKPVNVKLLDKEYLVACSEEERESLFEAAGLLDTRMRELRDAGKVIGSERIAVMAALNITHEFLEYKHSKADYNSGIDHDLKRIRSKIESALRIGRMCEEPEEEQPA